ncbi:hypothetical protein RNAN_1734 [Rheinheimera nanhaiensis E407-8]|uniref:Uncharacterized protein n=1 Tax=Rheinheimera nanhaiensis E407-8 TaxID=562729 RepID=I1DXG8_9GAMM|nr:hypothetical protein RNAN_1734 [Rheinheimera nanhaiensis E407-8]
MHTFAANYPLLMQCIPTNVSGFRHLFVKIAHAKQRQNKNNVIYQHDKIGKQLADS